MTQQDFCYWLQGFFEMSGEGLSKREVIIKGHLQEVFNKVTPNRSVHTLAEELQKKLQDQLGGLGKQTAPYVPPYQLSNSPLPVPSQMPTWNPNQVWSGSGYFGQATAGTKC